MLKSLFRRKAGADGRFISIYGLPWPRQSIADHLRTPDVCLGVGLTLTAVFDTAVRGLPDYLPFVVIEGLVATGSGAGLASLLTIMQISRYGRLHPKLIDEYAIDRDGRRQPPDAQASLKEQTERLAHYAKCMTLVMGSVGIYFRREEIGHIVYSAVQLSLPSPIAITKLCMMSALTARFAGLWYRCNRLLDGTYVYCANPPAAPRKVEAAARKTAFEGPGL